VRIGLPGSEAQPRTSAAPGGQTWGCPAEARCGAGGRPSAGDHPQSQAVRGRSDGGRGRS